MAKVLVADDVQSVRELLRAILEQENHEVEEAVDGNSVLEMIADEERDNYDLVLLDIGLPDIDGKTVMKKIIDMDGTRPKVCFVSGERDKEAIVDAIQHGGDDYIVKPIDIVVFKSKLAKFFGSSENEVFVVEASLTSRILELPMDVSVRITSMSELGLEFEGATPFKKQSTVKIESPTLNRQAGEDLHLLCVVESCTKKAKDTHQMKCLFSGMHDNQRDRLRKIIISGKPLVDPEPGEGS